MGKTMRRVQLRSDTDLIRLIEGARDGVSTVIERDGEALAVISPAEERDGEAVIPKSRRNREQLLALAGALSDIDGDAMIEDIYRWRHAMPPSPSVEP